MSEEMSEVKSAVRKARAKAIIVGGTWTADGWFVPCDKQPPATTELAAAAAWYRKNKILGRIEFVRRLPQALTNAEQLLFKSTLA